MSSTSKRSHISTPRLSAAKPGAVERVYVFDLEEVACSNPRLSVAKPGGVERVYVFDLEEVACHSPQVERSETWGKVALIIEGTESFIYLP